MITGDEAITEIFTGSLSAPFVEEILKGLAVMIVFLFFRHELDSILDGIVYAAITALGFAATENMLYMYQIGFVEDGWSGLWAVFFLRVILNAWSHASYTAFTGIGFAAARLSNNPGLKFLAPLLGLFSAMFVHFLHNTFLVFVESLGGMVLVYLSDWLGWLFISAIILWAVLRERKWIMEQLKDEIASGLITEEDYRTTLSPLRRSLATASQLSSGRFRATRDFYRSAAELAFKKQHAFLLGEASPESQRVIDNLRREIAGVKNKYPEI
jgi:hypothetical protein